MELWRFYVPAEHYWTCPRLRCPVCVVSPFALSEVETNTVVCEIAVASRIDALIRRNPDAIEVVDLLWAQCRRKQRYFIDRAIQESESSSAVEFTAHRHLGGRVMECGYRVVG